MNIIQLNENVNKEDIENSFKFLFYEKNHINILLLISIIIIFPIFLLINKLNILEIALSSIIFIILIIPVFIIIFPFVESIEKHKWYNYYSPNYDNIKIKKMISEEKLILEYSLPISNNKYFSNNQYINVIPLKNIKDIKHLYEEKKINYNPNNIFNKIFYRIYWKDEYLFYPGLHSEKLVIINFYKPISLYTYHFSRSYLWNIKKILMDKIIIELDSKYIKLIKCNNYD